MNADLKWMQRAFELAQKAEAEDEVPVGAVLVYQNQIIGEGWNQSIAKHDPTAHAEIIALREAASHLDNYRLPGTQLYVTLEPCAMCAGAMVHARIKKIFYAVDDPKSGACGSVMNLLQMNELNHRVETEKGLMENESRLLLKFFFKQKRNQSG